MNEAIEDIHKFNPSRDGYVETKKVYNLIYPLYKKTLASRLDKTSFVGWIRSKSSLINKIAIKLKEYSLESRLQSICGCGGDQSYIKTIDSRPYRDVIEITYSDRKKGELNLRVIGLTSRQIQKILNQ